MPNFLFVRKLACEMCKFTMRFENCEQKITNEIAGIFKGGKSQV
jgi:hypothetical protein